MEENIKKDQQRRRDRLGTYVCDQVIKWFGIWIKQAKQEEIDRSSPAFHIVAHMVEFFVNNCTDDLDKFLALDSAKAREDLNETKNS